MDNLQLRYNICIYISLSVYIKLQYLPWSSVSAKLLQTRRAAPAKSRSSQFIAMIKQNIRLPISVLYLLYTWSYSQPIHAQNMIFKPRNHYLLTNIISYVVHHFQRLVWHSSWPILYSTFFVNLLEQDLVSNVTYVCKTLRYIVRRYATLQDVTLRCKMLHYVAKTLHYVVKRYTTL